MHKSFAYYFATALTLTVFGAQAFSQTPSTRAPVLVELFTSEGCSSCPPADALLAKLDSLQPIPTAQVIILEEHVDYWDAQGWHDRFSSHQYTERQADYCFKLHASEPFTPQMIVDGTTQFVGNNAPQAVTAIQHAAQTTKLPLKISAPVVDGRKVSASVSLQTPSDAKPNTPVFAALVDSFDTTDVRDGENKGRQLNHSGVVRVLNRVGTIKDLNAGPVNFTFTAPSESKPAAMRVVVFAQLSGSGAILGVDSVNVTP
jgi:hypothetical protein